MVPWKVSTTKFEWLPDVPMAFAPSRPWKLHSITIWDDCLNQNQPTSSARQAEKLTLVARRPKTAQALAMRACIVLSCSDGLGNGEVARRLGITGATVCKWRERFRTQRLEGLLDEPRPRAPRSITDAQVEELITRTLKSMPANSTHWSTRLMAHKTGLSQTAIVRIRRAFGLQPHRVENFKFSKDPQLV